MQIYATFDTKCFFSRISQPIFILFVLFGRVSYCALIFYTEFWNWLPFNYYYNLCQFMQHLTQNVSSLAFLDQFSFCLFYLLVSYCALIFYTEFWNWVHFKYYNLIFYTEFWNWVHFKYYNLCKFMQHFTQNVLFPHFSTNFHSVCFIW